MSASRRLLGLRNASFAPQLGIKGLVSELLFHAIAKNRPTKRKWTLHVTVRALFNFHVKSQIHATEMWIIWMFRQSGFREALKLEIRSELLLIPTIGLILRCRFNDKQSSIKNVSLDILLVAWQTYLLYKEFLWSLCISGVPRSAHILPHFHFENFVVLTRKPFVLYFSKQSPFDGSLKQYILRKFRLKTMNIIFLAGFYYWISYLKSKLWIF